MKISRGVCFLLLVTVLFIGTSSDVLSDAHVSVSESKSRRNGGICEVCSDDPVLCDGDVYNCENCDWAFVEENDSCEIPDVIYYYIPNGGIISWEVNNSCVLQPGPLILGLVRVGDEYLACQYSSMGDCVDEINRMGPCVTVLGKTAAMFFPYYYDSQVMVGSKVHYKYGSESYEADNAFLQSLANDRGSCEVYKWGDELCAQQNLIINIVPTEANFYQGFDDVCQTLDIDPYQQKYIKKEVQTITDTEPDETDAETVADTEPDETDAETVADTEPDDPGVCYEVLVNGDFEVGSFANWIVEDANSTSFSCDQKWEVTNTFVSDDCCFHCLDPLPTSYVAWSAFEDTIIPRERVFYQTFDVPPDTSFSSVNASFSFVLRNSFTGKSATLHRFFNVEILSSSDVLLRTLYSEAVSPGTLDAFPIFYTWDTITDDLTTLFNDNAGETLRITFTSIIPEANQGRGQLYIDDVSIEACISELDDETIADTEPDDPGVCYEVLENGDFEVGSFANWIVEDANSTSFSCDQKWEVTNTFVSDDCCFHCLDPLPTSYVAWSAFEDTIIPRERVFYQTFDVPPDTSFSSVNASFSFVLRNSFTGKSATLHRFFNVEILSSSDVLLRTLYSEAVAPGTLDAFPIFYTWDTITDDLTTLFNDNAGETLRITFTSIIPEANQGRGQLYIDDVSIEACISELDDETIADTEPEVCSDLLTDGGFDSFDSGPQGPILAPWFAEEIPSDGSECGWIVVPSGYPCRCCIRDQPRLNASFSEGGFYATSSFATNTWSVFGGRVGKLYQEFTVPSDPVALVEVSWNHALVYDFTGLDRFFFVEIWDATRTTLLDTLYELVVTSPALDVDGTRETFSFDRTDFFNAHAGETLVVQFTVVLQDEWTGPGDIGIDSVAIVACSTTEDPEAETEDDTEPDDTDAETVADTDPDETDVDSVADTELSKTDDTFGEWDCEAQCSKGKCVVTPKGETKCLCDKRWSNWHKWKSDFPYPPFCEHNDDILDNYEGTREPGINFDDHSQRRRTFSGQLVGFDRTILDVCENEYWGILITSEYELCVYGENIDNDYLVADNSVPVKIDTSSWKIVPKKVTCTMTSLFVLGISTEDRETGTLFIMGRNEHFELNGGEVLTSFKRDLVGVQDVVSSYHTVYVSMKNSTILPCVFTIKAIGENNFGEFGSGSIGENSMNHENTYVDVDLSNFPIFDNSLGYTGYDGNKYPDLVAKELQIFPTIIPFEHGAVFKFTRKLLYFVGKDHPSLVDASVSVPTLIDFDGVRESELQNVDPIDHISRMYGGCLYIMSANRIFISGSSDCGEWGIESNSMYSYPFQIQEPLYGDYSPRDGFDKIYRMWCGYACYFLTQEKLYVVGRVSDETGFDAQCANDNCQKLTLASTDVQRIYSNPGSTIAVDFSRDAHFDVIGIKKPVNFNTFLESEVYKYRPALVFEESGIEDDVLTLLIRHEEVFLSLSPSIYFIDPLTGLIKSADRCIYPRIVESNWTTWNEKDEENGFSYFYYELQLPWRDHVLSGTQGGCHWISPQNNSRTNEEYDVYSNRLMYDAYYYRGMYHGEARVRREQFIFDLHVRFPKEVLNVDITVEQDELSDWVDFYIVDKSFDRVTRKGVIEFSSMFRKPNFLVFSDVDHPQIPSNFHKPRLSEVTPNVPEYFIPEFFHVGEKDGGVVTPETLPLCDEKYCYQQFVVEYQIISDYRVCFVPKTIIPINFVTFCASDLLSDSNCVTPSRELTYQIHLSVDNLCGGELFEEITTLFILEVFSDWTYENVVDTNEVVFQVDDWVYFRATLECGKVSILGITIDTVTVVWNDQYHKLYHPNPDSNGSPKYVSSLVGDDCQFVVDELGIANQIGFHFRLSNSLLQLQPGVTQNYEVQVYLSVDYEGNNNAVTPESQPDVSGDARRSNDVVIGETFVQSSLAISVESVLENGINAVPYVVVSTFLVFAAVSLAILLMGGVVITVVTIRKNRTKN